VNRLKLDALAYPTGVRRPALIGDPQLGVNCALSAQTGLPSISTPAGFTADGLSTRLELMGRAFSDSRLVELAHAYEQAGPRRRQPYSAPARDHWRATFAVVAGLANDDGTGSDAFAPLSSDLSFTLRTAPSIASKCGHRHSPD
jgi:hypothetical protein